MKTFKQKVQLSFDKGSENYDFNSKLQKIISDEMLSFFFQEFESLKKKVSLLDLGCGTGEISKKLNEKLNLKTIHLVDISKKMIEKSMEKFKDDKVVYDHNDFDYFDNFKDYDLIVSNMSIHWSNDIVKLLKKILNSIKKDAVVLLSFPNSMSLRDLKKFQKKFVNDFPNILHFSNIFDCKKIYFKQKELIHEERFESILDFLKNLRKIGANVSNKKLISFKDLISLRRDKSSVKIRFNISCIFFRKI